MNKVRKEQMDNWNTPQGRLEMLAGIHFPVLRTLQYGSSARNQQISLYLNHLSRSGRTEEIEALMKMEAEGTITFKPDKEKRIELIRAFPIESKD
jgi:hypothetical protein